MDGLDQATLDRFWAKVDKSGGEDACWNWTASLDPAGYGGFKLNGKKVNAHRLSYVMANGPVPEGREACHRCNNPACVNPGHLYAGTRRDNVLDAVRAGAHAFRPGHAIGHRFQRGEHHPRAKITVDAARDIYRRAKLGKETLEQIGRAYGVSKSAVNEIKRRGAWSWATDPNSDG